MTTPSVPPIVAERTRGRFGCLAGCGLTVFLSLFLPLGLGAILGPGDRWSMLQLTFIVAAIPAIVGGGMLAIFAHIHAQKWAVRYEQFRNHFALLPDMPDNSFCAAIPDCDPHMLIAYRSGVAEYFGVSAARIHPHEEIHFEEDQIDLGSAVLHCLDKLHPRKINIEWLSENGWDDSPSTRVDEQARFYCRAVTAISKRM